MSRRRLSRPLGTLETSFQLYYDQGADIASQLLLIASKDAVTPKDVHLALICIFQRHPLLRMAIQRHDQTRPGLFTFVEMPDQKVNFEVINRNDWKRFVQETATLRFDLANGPLWNCMLLSPDINISDHLQTRRHPEFRHTIAFVFSWHHCLFDASYLMTILADFIGYLDNIVQNRSVDQTVKSYELLPPLDSVIISLRMKMASHEQTNNSLRYSRLLTNQEVSNDPSTTALNLYKHAFAAEISQLSSASKVSDSVDFYLSEAETVIFLRKCKANKVTVASAMMAASSLAYCHLLVKSGITIPPLLEIPVECLLNLRRYLPPDQQKQIYPGVGAVHVPLSIRVAVKSESVTEVEFWDLARRCLSVLHDAVRTDKPIQAIQDEAREIPTLAESYQPTVGKSPYVLCLSSVGDVDSLLFRSEAKKRFQVLDLVGTSTILVDDMPIFCVFVVSLQKRLRTTIVYCSSYTSLATTMRYWGYLNQYVQMGTKL
jgi:hypothetical protein